MEISQYITIGDLTGFDEGAPLGATEPTLPPETANLTLPSLSFDDDGFADLTPKLTLEEEDALLKVEFCRIQIKVQILDHFSGFDRKLPGLDRKLHSARYPVVGKPTRRGAKWFKWRCHGRCVIS